MIGKKELKQHRDEIISLIQEKQKEVEAIDILLGSKPAMDKPKRVRKATNSCLALALVDLERSLPNKFTLTFLVDCLVAKHKGNQTLKEFRKRVNSTMGYQSVMEVYGRHGHGRPVTFVKRPLYFRGKDIEGGNLNPKSVGKAL